MHQSKAIQRRILQSHAENYLEDINVVSDFTIDDATGGVDDDAIKVSAISEHLAAKFDDEAHDANQDRQGEHADAQPRWAGHLWT